MDFQQWARPELRKLLPLDDQELGQVISYTNTLSDSEAAQHLENLLGDSPQSVSFIASFMSHRAKSGAQQAAGGHSGEKGGNPHQLASNNPFYTPPTPAAPSVSSASALSAPSASSDSKPPIYDAASHLPAYAAVPSGPPVLSGPSRHSGGHHVNNVIRASNLRARDEQEMQQLLQNLQYTYRIYNSDLEPEHETEYSCSCPIHQFQQRKWARLGVQETWCKAVMYPKEKFYSDNPYGSVLLSGNPYKMRLISPYGRNPQLYFNGPSRPIPDYHAEWIRETIGLHNHLNQEAQRRIDAQEPRTSIWKEDTLSNAMENLAVHEKDGGSGQPSTVPSNDQQGKPKSRFAGLKKALGVKPSEEKAAEKATALRREILAEENGRWPDEQWWQIVRNYQDKVGMARKIADLRAHRPIQYLHLLKAGYFEPIPVAWATQASNPLKFTVEAAAGWRGITPTWRGYEDLAEERLYWVLNHREGSAGMRMKPDFISEMNMAQARMARAVEPPPLYFAADDTCHVQHISDGYSKQVMPPPFRAFDRPESSLDDTMILLDVSGSMDFDPVRPVYNQYLVTGFTSSSQPRNKDVAKSIVRRFADAMANHDRRGDGYDLVTFSDRANYIGTVNHNNLRSMWHKVRFGGGTRVMTGWQLVKELHFRKHSESATHHPIYGWQAGPNTPMLRLLLLLDGEATDMDEFELDLLGLSWAHVTIFLIGVDGCPHHHRHANELQRISDVNHHVSFVDAQGNCPERFVTHELLKRHLGYDIPMREFEQMEQLPAYSA